jgi:hypothetical protein
MAHLKTAFFPLHVSLASQSASQPRLSETAKLPCLSVSRLTPLQRGEVRRGTQPGETCEGATDAGKAVEREAEAAG